MCPFLQDLTQITLIKQVLVTSLRQDHAANLKHISNTRVLMATKLGRLKYSKLKLLHLHYKSAYGHQAWEDGNLP